MNGRRPAFTSWFTRDRETPRILAASRFVANQGCPGVYRCRARVSTSVSSRPRRCLLIALGSSPLETQRSTVLARTPRMRAASAELSPWQGPDASSSMTGSVEPWTSWRHHERISCGTRPGGLRTGFRWRYASRLVDGPFLPETPRGDVKSGARLFQGERSSVSEMTEDTVPDL